MISYAATCKESSIEKVFIKSELNYIIDYSLFIKPTFTGFIQAKDVLIYILICALMHVKGKKIWLQMT